VDTLPTLDAKVDPPCLLIREIDLAKGCEAASQEPKIALGNQ